MLYNDILYIFVLIIFYYEKIQENVLYRLYQVNKTVIKAYMKDIPFFPSFFKKSIFWNIYLKYTVIRGWIGYDLLFYQTKVLY